MIPNLLLMSIAVQSPAPLYPIPSERQLEWHGLEYYAFVHFGPNTFTGEEWGHGTEDPNLFNPSQLDCAQWVRTFKAAGMKGVIITAKHHDGFCLWPSKFSTHTVAQSKWKNGKGDVLRALSEACKREGLKFGVYLSPWDRNHPAYGTPEYNDVFVAMLREVIGAYGPVFEVWFDGANGEGPNGKRQVYDWEKFVDAVRESAPGAVIFSDAGPDVRWVGNESGFAGETNWCFLNRDELVPGTSRYRELTEGHANGRFWVPAECDVSIRPGWFWRASEDSKVKTVAQLEAIYFASVGRGAPLLLNVPPDNRGLIHENDVAALMALRARLNELFRIDHTVEARSSATETRAAAFAARHVLDRDPNTFWCPTAGVLPASITLELRLPSRVSMVVLQERIALGQRVEAFSIEALVGAQWRSVASGTTIGYKRILRFDSLTATALRITIERSRSAPAISEISAY
jgi:alpha-L-fucosidase